MALSEGTCLCLFFGIVCLTLVLKGTLNLQNDQSREAKQPAVAATQFVPAPPAAPAEPLPDAEKQREILESQLEVLHRDEWCRKFEEQEIKEHTRQMMYKYAIQRRAMMLDDAKNYLRDLRMRRMALQQRLVLEERYANAAQWNVPGRYIEGPYVEGPYDDAFDGDFTDEGF